MTRSSSSRKRRQAGPSLLRRLLGLGFKLALVGLVLLIGVAIYFDGVVQEKFSGKRWTIPAKVYARPLELFVGQKLKREILALPGHGCLNVHASLLPSYRGASPIAAA